MSIIDTNYIVVAAPGHYGDVTKVISSHRTVELARKAARKLTGVVVRRSSLTKGDTFLRCYEQISAEAL